MLAIISFIVTKINIFKMNWIGRVRVEFPCPRHDQPGRWENLNEPILQPPDVYICRGEQQGIA